MVQLYFLSIICNGFAAYILFARDDWESEPLEAGMKFSLQNEIVRLVLGIFTAIIGFLKLLLPYTDTKGIPILGDFLPALAGLAAGFVLVFGYYREHVKVIDQEGKLDRIGDGFLRWKKSLGFALMLVSLMHFLFPQALFL